MRRLMINPLLISVATGRKLEEIPAVPDVFDLPGKYPAIVAENLDKIEPPYVRSIESLICTECGKDGEYDVGLMTINWALHDPNSKRMDAVQMCGYFRCIHCNSAGKWEYSPDIYAKLTLEVMKISQGSGNMDLFTQIKLHDGTTHQYATDSETHLLNKLIHKDDSYLWNKLGNIYHKGNRADLAVCAFERSLELDANQAESHYTLGIILAQAGLVEEAVSHYQRALLAAKTYRHMEDIQLRDFVSATLRELAFIQHEYHGKIQAMPELTESQKAYISRNSNRYTLSETGTLDLDLDTDDPASFYQFAEIILERQVGRKKISQLPGKKKKKKARKR